MAFPKQTFPEVGQADGDADQLDRSKRYVQ